MRSNIYWLALLLIIASAQTASAQEVTVEVNGTPVRFDQVGARMVQGRVLVPLRGVLEQIGAFVEWVPSTRTVLAQRGNNNVVLPVGNRTAFLNGRAITLDVPATIISGTTMVPLRFLSEALGADVRWQSFTRTVQIVTGEDGTQPPPPPGTTLNIRSISHNAAGWLVAGSLLQVNMEGTPGGTATFDIPGVISNVNMNEVNPGQYVGTWNVPTNAQSISGASVVAQLRVGTTEKYIQAANPIRIDTTPPEIDNLRPEPNSSIAQRQPNISAVFDDAAGSGIDLASVRLTVNNANVAADADITQSFISYKPPTALPVGENRISLSVSDRAGNVARETWRFTVRSATDVIRSFTFDAPEVLRPGEVITVRMEASPDGEASFYFMTSTGQRLRMLPMQEISSGVYEGEYTIRRDEDLRGASVMGTFTTANGETFTVEAEENIGGTTGALSAPTITAPRPNEAASSPLTVTGRAPANSRVRLRIVYETTVLGSIKMNGTIYEQMVDVNNQGIFRTDPIELTSGLIKGKNTIYTLTAVTVGTNNQESEPVTVTFTKA